MGRKNHKSNSGSGLRFDRVAENINEGVVEIDEKGKVVYINSRAFEMISSKKEELFLKPFFEIFEEPERYEIEELLDGIKEGDECEEGISIEVSHKKTEIILNFFPFDKGNGYLIILDDVNENKLMEAQFIQAQKMEAVGTLAAGIAHDFNNLLMGIQGNAALMLNDIDFKHPYYDRLKSIEKQVQNGAKLTSQLLGYSRRENSEKNRLELNSTISDLAETFGRTRKEICIELGLSENLFTVKAEQSQVEQILMNLLINASDAMPRGGDLIIKTANISSDDIINTPYEPVPGHYVCLSVVDTGFGMSEEIKDRIFDPFFTTKGMGRGTGLGLASVYGIVKGCGGYIDVESEIGKGSVFKVYLPAKKSTIENDVFTEESGQVELGNELVLLVDDEDEVRNIGKEMIEVLGYTVLTAEDGKKAIQLFKENRYRIAVVLLDMVMPKMSGSEVYDFMKEIDRDVAVLLLSGYGIDGKAKEILSKGCNGFIQKPFEIKQLSTSIRKVINQRNELKKNICPDINGQIAISDADYILEEKRG